ncbi:MAG: MFS transporter [Bacteroidetes bacterium]|nr:MFS transporter [Bacteroidota bacterium]
MRINNKTKIFYGIGFISVGIKDVLYSIFVFFYFSQILGLDPIYTGSATLIAIMFDAISDPIIGTISDNFKSTKWGRRHPIMLMSAFPLGISTYLLFLPPSGISEFNLFLWMTIFSILIRLFLTLFLVPGMSLGAELSSDYDERTVITSFRIMFTTLVSPFVCLFGLIFIFIPKEGMSTGLQNVEAYPKFALICAILMVCTILISVFGTKHTIPSLPKMNKRESIGSLLKNILVTVKMKSFNSIVLFTMMIYIAFGIGNSLTTYFLSYFFELDQNGIAAIIFSGGIAGVLSLFIAPRLGRLYDKKTAVIISTALFGFFISSPYNLRLLDLFPSNESRYLLISYLTLSTIGFTFLWTAMSLANSMMADVVDEYESITNQRHEGLFFSTMSFAYKLTVGVGYFFAGILLKIIAFPTQSDISEISPETISKLGLIGGPILMVIYLTSIFFIIKYPITKSRYNEIREKLNQSN